MSAVFFQMVRISHMFNSVSLFSAYTKAKNCIDSLLFDLWTHSQAVRGYCLGRRRSRGRRGGVAACARNPIFRVLEKMGAVESQKGMSHIPVATVDELASADAVIFGTPTQFGNMCGQTRQFLDATGQLRAQGALVDKVCSVFTCSATQHSGQESTILSFHTSLLQHAFVIVGLPYSFQCQMRTDEITGGSPYGASTIAGVQVRECLAIMNWTRCVSRAGTKAIIGVT